MGIGGRVGSSVSTSPLFERSRPCSPHSVHVWRIPLIVRGLCPADTAHPTRSASGAYRSSRAACVPLTAHDQRSAVIACHARSTGTVHDAWELVTARSTFYEYRSLSTSRGYRSPRPACIPRVPLAVTSSHPRGYRSPHTVRSSRMVHVLSPHTIHVPRSHFFSKNKSKHCNMLRGRDDT